MYILWMLIIGFVIGGVVDWLAPGRHPSGPYTSILFGTTGSMLASLVDHVVGWRRQSVDGLGILVSVLGALFAVLLFQLVVRWRARPVG